MKALQFSISDPISRLLLTELTTYISQLVQIRTVELETENFDPQNDIILKFIVSHENDWNIVDRNKLPFLNVTAFEA